MHTHRDRHTPSVPPGVAAGSCAPVSPGLAAPAVAAGSSASPRGRSSAVGHSAPSGSPEHSLPADRSSPTTVAKGEQKKRSNVIRNEDGFSLLVLVLHLEPYSVSVTDTAQHSLSILDVTVMAAIAHDHLVHN